MKITKNGLETTVGPSSWFAGSVYIDVVSTPLPPSRVMGDRVYFEPGENHWHGATPGHFNTQIAYQETDDTGSHTTWGRHVTDKEYPG